MQATTFVGRKRELQILRNGLSEAIAGHGQVVLIAGEPGIGKTRIAEELIDSARHQGAGVLWGSCYEWEGAPAFWPWIQVIRGYVRSFVQDDLAELLGTGATDIAQIVPDVAERYPNLPPLPTMDAEQGRFRLFDAIMTLLRNVSGHRPLVIVLDDLHWSDEPSLQLLHFATQEIRDTPLLIIGTYRQEDFEPRGALTRTMSEITRERGSLWLRLDRLSPAEVHEYIAASIGVEPPASLNEAVYKEIEGNPFFMTEVIRLLLGDETFDPSSQTSAWRIRIPESVRAVVGQRLDRLSSDSRRVLGTAAVIGREFDLAIVERIVDLKKPQLLDVLDEALRAQLIQERDVVGQFRFSHSLVQETIYLQLTTAGRARMHHAVGEAIEAVHAGNIPSRYAELAHHYYLSTPVGDMDKAVTYATGAGDYAMSRFAWESAVVQYQRALQVLDVMGSTNQLRRCKHLISLGNAQNRSGPGSGDVAAARTTFEQATEIARDIDASEEFARAAIGYAGFNVAATFGGHRQVQLLEEALTRLGPTDSALRVQVLSRLAEDLATVSPEELERVRVLGTDAVETARRLRDPSSLAVALTARHVSGLGPDNLNERIADSGELIELADRADDLLTIAWAGFWGNLTTMLDLVEIGDVAGAERAMQAVELVAEKAQIPYITLRAIVYRTMLLLMTGRFSEAEPLIAQARELWRSGGVQQHLFQLFVLRREQDRLAELEEDLRTAIQEAPAGINRYSRLHPTFLMALQLETGREQEAREQFEALAADSLSDIPAESSWDGVMALLSEVCAKLGDVERAKLLYDLLIPYEGRNVVLTVSAVCLGSNSHYLGLLATTLSRWDQAEVHFSAALSMQERMNMRPYIAHTQYAYALMLAKRNGPDDRERAVQLLEAAHDTAEPLGMSRLEDEIAELMNSIGSSAVERSGLTPREVDVLRLVSQGFTDVEIALQLTISPRTVNAHMRSLFSKLDVSSRAAATRAAIERNLV